MSTSGAHLIHYLVCEEATAQCDLIVNWALQVPLLTYFVKCSHNITGDYPTLYLQPHHIPYFLALLSDSAVSVQQCQPNQSLLQYVVLVLTNGRRQTVWQCIREAIIFPMLLNKSMMSR